MGLPPKMAIPQKKAKRASATVNSLIILYLQTFLFPKKIP
jgi:hypothetical protein